jgi:hypothetical protein
MTRPKLLSAYAAGAITPEAVLAFHRAVFGDARMADGDQPDGDDGQDGDDGDGDDGAGDNDGETPPKPKPGDEGRGGKTALQRDLARERRNRQKVEAELAELRKANETETERKIREAREEGATTARAEQAERMAESLLRMALRTGGASEEDITEIAEGFSPRKFIGDDGAIDEERLVKWARRAAPKPAKDDDGGGGREAPPAGYGAGRGSGKQLTAKERARQQAEARGHRKPETGTPNN